MLVKNNFLLLFCLLFSQLVFAASSDKYFPITVVLHVHSNISGEGTTIEEISHSSRQQGVEAIVLTDYFQQKLSWKMLSHQKPSILKFGIEKYYQRINAVNQKIGDVLTLPGAEVTPFYWWSGSPLQWDWTVHDMQKNLLVFGLDEKAMRALPTLENGASKFDADHGPQNDEPYQAFIDYVKDRGGISVWSTPDEAFGAEFKMGPLHFSTPSYTESLTRTHGYTGVAIYPEGFIKTGAVGGVWDQLLLKYCQGKLADPIWAFSEGVIHQKGLNQYLHRWDNQIWVNERSASAILEGFHEGRFYIRKVNQGQVRLDAFMVSDTEGSGVALSGQEMKVFGDPVIHIRASISEEVVAEKMIVEIIRNGEVIHTQESQGPEFSLDMQDESDFPIGQKRYYRITAITRPKDSGSFISNPIFITKKASLAESAP